MSRSLLDGTRSQQFPLDRLLREAKATVKRPTSTTSTNRRADPDAPLRKVLLETAFRFELILRINITTHELLDREVLRAAALAANLALLAGAPTPRSPVGWPRASWHPTPAPRSFWRPPRARSVVEARYLAGHTALFPDEAVRFTDQVEATQRQTMLAMRLAELDGLPPGEPGHPDAVAARAEVLVEDLVEPAKGTALEKLGDGRQALSIATRWLRGKAESPDR